jgi:hypothetical protein
MNKETLKDQAWYLLSRLYVELKSAQPNKTKLNRVFVFAIHRYQRRLRSYLCLDLL